MEAMSMHYIKFLRIPDSDFTFHYEIKGPDELVESQRNTRKGVGLKARRLRNGEYGENNERR
jgi:hypothetical protein